MGLCVGATTDCQGAIAPYLVIFLVTAFQVCMRQHAGHASNQINIINKKKLLFLTKKKGRWSLGIDPWPRSRVRIRFWYRHSRREKCGTGNR